VARINLEVVRLTFAALQNVPHEIRAMARPEVQATVEAIAAVLDEIARELPTYVAVGVDNPPPASRVRARSAMDALSARVIQIRPAYIGKASSGEIENFAAFIDSLAVLTSHIERCSTSLRSCPPRRRRTVLFRDCPTLRILQLSTIQPESCVKV
jgi:hypothetical protein